MFTNSDLENFSSACDAISGELADEKGFVPVRKLLRRFGVELIARPLLVEGMLASVDDPGIPHKWALLVDSETYRFTRKDVDEESIERPLPSRLRNTIAHELVHSLAFRPSEFGIRFRSSNTAKVSAPDIVRAIENETERLSSRLLIPNKALKPLLQKKEAISLPELSETFRAFGVSRYLLINRLNLLKRAYGDGYGLPDRLRNIAIGLAITKDGTSVLKKWPLYFNFDRGIVPVFLLKLFHQDDLPLQAFLQESMKSRDGSDKHIEATLKAGNSASPNQVDMRVRISIEGLANDPKWKDSRALFLVQRLEME